MISGLERLMKVLKLTAYVKHGCKQKIMISTCKTLKSKCQRRKTSYSKATCEYSIVKRRVGYLLNKVKMAARTACIRNRYCR